MNNPLTAKLRNFAPLSNDDAAVLDLLCSDIRPYRAKQDLIKEGDRPEVVFLLVEGGRADTKSFPTAGARSWRT